MSTAKTGVVGGLVALLRLLLLLLLA